MPPEIAEQMQATRDRLRRVIWWQGAGWLVLAIVGVVVFAGVVDWLFHVSSGMRLLFVLLLGGTSAWLAYRYWIVPLSIAVSDLQLALRVERQHPELAERLSSTVGFLNIPKNDPLAGSPELRERVIQEALQAIKSVDFEETVQSRPARKVGTWAAIAAGFALLLVVISPSDAAIALRRLASPFGGPEWPKRTQFRIVDAPASVAIGDPFSVDVEVVGVVPPRVQVLYRFDENEQIAPEPLRPLKDNVLRGGFEPVSRPFEFSIVGGDGQTEWQKVDAVPAPELDMVKVALAYPSYTGLPAEEYPEGRGHVRAVVGTKVSITAKANKKLSKAELLWDKVGSTPATVGEDPTTIHAEFIVQEDGVYRIVVHDTEGMSNQNRFPKQFRVQAVADAAPEVTIEQPAGDLELTKDAVLPIKVLVKDDFGIGKVELSYLKSNEALVSPAEQPAQPAPPVDAAKEENEPADAQAKPDPGQPPVPVPNEVVIELANPTAIEKRQYAEHSWALAPLGLATGDVLRFHVRAQDRRDDPGSNLGKSRELRVRIVDKDQFLTQIDREQQLLREEIERILKLQESAERQVADLEKEAEAKGELNRDQIAQLQSVEMAQRRIREKVTESDQSLDKQIGRMLDSLKNNKVDDVDTTKRLVMMRSELSRVAEQHLPPISQSLTNARKQSLSQGSGQPQAAESGSEPRAGEENAPATSPSPDASPTKAEQPADAAKETPMPQADAAKASDPALAGKPEDARSSSPSGAPDAKPPEKDSGSKASPESGAAPEQSAAGKQKNEGPSEQPSQPPEEKSARPKENPTSELARAQTHQREVVSSLRQMLDQLQEWETVAQVVNDARELQRRQNEVSQKTQKLADETLGKRTEDLTPEQTAELAKAADRQEEAREQLQRLQRKMSRIAEGTEGEDPTSSETLKDALENTRQENVSGKMAEAASDLKGNRMGDAASRQKEIDEALKNLVDSLENRREQELARLVKQLKQAEKELENIREEQRQLQKKTKEAESIKDPKQREEELQRLQRRQRELQQKTQDFAKRLSRLRAEEASQKSGRASGRMDKAQQQMGQGQGQQAGQEQQQAEQELEEAQQQLAEARQQAEDELAQEQLAKISDAIRQIHEREMGVRDEVSRLEGLREKNGRLTRGEMQSIVALSRAQRGLSGEAEGLTQKLTAAKVFVLVIEEAVKSMNDAAGLLAKRETGSETQEKVDTAVQRFALLLDSLQAQRAEGKQKGEGQEQGGGQGGGAGGGGDGIPGIAQIKLLKLLQTELKSKTLDLAKLREPDGKWSEKNQKKFEELSQTQGRLADMVRELSEPAPEPEPEPEEGEPLP